VSRPLRGGSSCGIGRQFSSLFVSACSNRETFGNEGGGGGVELAPWLLNDFRGSGAGSRTRGGPFFDCLTSSSLILSKFRNFSFPTKKDFRPEWGVCAVFGENGVEGEVGDNV
jgi:hypothetical protein